MNIGNLIEGRASSAIVTCTVDQTMRDVVALLADRRIGALPVMEEGRVAGIFSERDVLYCLAKEGAAALDRPVATIVCGPETAGDWQRDHESIESNARRPRAGGLGLFFSYDLPGLIPSPAPWSSSRKIWTGSVPIARMKSRNSTTSTRRSPPVTGIVQHSGQTRTPMEHQQL